LNWLPYRSALAPAGARNEGRALSVALVGSVNRCPDCHRYGLEDERKFDAPRTLLGRARVAGPAL